MTADRYSLREFDRCRDMDAVIRCYESGFYATLWPLFKYSDRTVLEDMVTTDHRVADVALVAEAGGEARGVLFGMLPNGPLGEARRIALVAGFMFRRTVSRRSQMRPFARAVLWHSVSRELLYYLHGPRGRAAEVETLTSQEGWRGGIGRILVDEFVRLAGARGFTRVDLGTDSELSWGFYEAYGFKRVAAWPHHAYDYSLPGRDVTAFIYSLELKAKADLDAVEEGGAPELIPANPDGPD